MVYRFIKRRSTGSAFLWFLPCCDWWNTTPETQRTSAIIIIFHFLCNWSWQMVKPFDWWRHMIPSLKCCIFDKKQRASNLPFRFLLSTSIYNDVICELHWTELNTFVTFWIHCMLHKSYAVWMHTFFVLLWLVASFSLVALFALAFVLFVEDICICIYWTVMRAATHSNVMSRLEMHILFTFIHFHWR